MKGTLNENGDDESQGLPPKAMPKGPPSPKPDTSKRGGPAARRTATAATAPATYVRYVPPPAPPPPDPAQIFYNQLRAYNNNALYLQLKGILEQKQDIADAKKVHFEKLTYDQLTLLTQIATANPAQAQASPLLKQSIQEELQSRNKKIASIYQHLLSKGLVSESTQYRDYCNIDGILQIGNDFFPTQSVMGVGLGFDLFSSALNDFFVTCFTSAILNPDSTVIDLAISQLLWKNFKSSVEEDIRTSAAGVIDSQVGFLNREVQGAKRNTSSFSGIKLQILPAAPAAAQPKLFIVSGLGNTDSILLEIVAQLNALIKAGVRAVTLYLPNDTLAQLPAKIIVDLYIHEINRRSQYFSSFSFAYVTPRDDDPLKVDDLPTLTIFQTAIESHKAKSEEQFKKAIDEWETTQFWKLLAPTPESPVVDDVKEKTPPPTLQQLFNNLQAWQTAVMAGKEQKVITAAEKLLIDNYDESQLSVYELTNFFNALTATDISKKDSLKKFCTNIEADLDAMIKALKDTAATTGAKVGGEVKHHPGFTLPRNWPQQLVTLLLKISRYTSPRKDHAIRRLMYQWWPVFITLNTEQLSPLSVQLTTHPDPLLQGVRRALNRLVVSRDKEAKNPTTEVAKLLKKQAEFAVKSQADVKAIATLFETLEDKLNEIGNLPSKTLEELSKFTLAQLRQVKESQDEKTVPKKARNIATLGLEELSKDFPFAAIVDHLVQFGVIIAEEKQTAIAILDEMRICGGVGFLFNLKLDRTDRSKLQRLRLLTSWFYCARQESAPYGLDKNQILQYSLKHFTNEASKKDKTNAGNILRNLLHPQTVQAHINAGVPLPKPYLLTDEDIDTLFTLVPDYKIQRVALSEYEGTIGAEIRAEKQLAKQRAEKAAAAAKALQVAKEQQEKEALATTTTSGSNGASQPETSVAAGSPEAAERPAESSNQSEPKPEAVAVANVTPEGLPGGSGVGAETGESTKKAPESTEGVHVGEAAAAKEAPHEAVTKPDGPQQESAVEAAKQGDEGEKAAAEDTSSSQEQESPSVPASSDASPSTPVAAKVETEPEKEQKEKEKGAEAKSEAPSDKGASQEQAPQAEEPIIPPLEKDLLFSGSGLLNLSSVIAAESKKEGPQKIPVMIHLPGHWVRCILSITPNVGDEKQTHIQLDIVDSRECCNAYKRFFAKAIQLLTVKAQQDGLPLSFTHTYTSERTQSDKDGHSCGYLGFQGLLKHRDSTLVSGDHKEKDAPGQAPDLKRQACTTITKAKLAEFKLQDATVQAFIAITTSPEEQDLETRQQQQATSLPPLSQPKDSGRSWSLFGSKTSTEPPSLPASLRLAARGLGIPQPSPAVAAVVGGGGGAAAARSPHPSSSSSAPPTLTGPKEKVATVTMGDGSDSAPAPSHSLSNSSPTTTGPVSVPGSSSDAHSDSAPKKAQSDKSGNKQGNGKEPVVDKKDLQSDKPDSLTRSGSGSGHSKQKERDSDKLNQNQTTKSSDNHKKETAKQNHSAALEHSFSVLPPQLLPNSLERSLSHIPPSGPLNSPPAGLPRSSAFSSTFNITPTLTQPTDANKAPKPQRNLAAFPFASGGGKLQKPGSGAAASSNSSSSLDLSPSGSFNLDS